MLMPVASDSTPETEETEKVIDSSPDAAEAQEYYPPPPVYNPPNPALNRQPEFAQKLTQTLVTLPLESQEPRVFSDAKSSSSSLDSTRVAYEPHYPINTPVAQIPKTKVTVPTRYVRAYEHSERIHYNAGVSRHAPSAQLQPTASYLDNLHEYVPIKEPKKSNIVLYAFLIILLILGTLTTLGFFLMPRELQFSVADISTQESPTLSTAGQSISISTRTTFYIYNPNYYHITARGFIVSGFVLGEQVSYGSSTSRIEIDRKSRVNVTADYMIQWDSSKHNLDARLLQACRSSLPLRIENRYTVKGWDWLHYFYGVNQGSMGLLCPLNTFELTNWQQADKLRKSRKV